jgi:hypothetical protein
MLKAGCVNGVYQVLVRKARNVQFFTVPISAGAVRLEGDVRVVAGPAPRRYGLGCFSGTNSIGVRDGFWGVVTPGRGYDIVSYEEDTRADRATAVTIATQRPGFSRETTHHIRIDCAPDLITMSVDGQRFSGANLDSMAASIAGEKPSAFKHAGFVVFPSRPGSDVRFDNFIARKLPPGASANALAPYAAVTKWGQQERFGTNGDAVNGAIEFVQDGCLSCHTYLRAGSSRAGAPDLSAEGRKHRGASWQVAHLKCPACRVPDRRCRPSGT